MAVTRADKFTAINKKEEIYSDFMTDFTPHPDTNELMRITNESAVVRSIRNLILTNKYDRLFQPELGGNLMALLFEPMGFATIEEIRRVITDTIHKHEKRARVVECSVNESPDNNAYFVTLVFYIINRQDPITTNLTLYRVR